MNALLLIHFFYAAGNIYGLYNILNRVSICSHNTDMAYFHSFVDISYMVNYSNSIFTFDS